jgi:glycosyltransferase involved in cell wall biosynthesis
MKIALLNTLTPFVRGGAEILVDDLEVQLRLHGHSVDMYRLPFPSSYEGPLVCTIAAVRMLRLDAYERVIAFKFPAYCVRHQAKVMWMFHQFRQVYELWGLEYGLKPTPEAQSIREIVKAADNEDIPRSRHIYTNAWEVTKRLKKYNDIESEVLPPPLKNAEDYFCRSTGDYIFYPSRITDLKRQKLAVEAMKHTKSGVKLIIAGRCSEPAYLEQINAIIKDYDLHNRVQVIDEWISDDNKIRLMADCLGVMYIPYKEDSYGFVSMEGFYCSKPVIACSDSGGTEELIKDGLNGFIADSTPDAIAEAMDRLFEDKHMSERMGAAGRDEILRRDITWTSTIRRLLV